MKADYVHKDTLTSTDYFELVKNDELLISYNQLLKENEELKKQLEEYKKKLMIATRMEIKQIDETTFVGIDYFQDECIMLKNQQQEFIKYLEDEINKISKEIKHYDIWHEVSDINFLILKKQLYKEVLQKYKEIIGDSDENK